MAVRRSSITNDDDDFDDSFERPKLNIRANFNASNWSASFVQHAPNINKVSLDNDDDMWNYFTALKKLGRGSFAVVYLVENKKTSVKYAAKILDKDMDDNDRDTLVNELSMLERLAQHPNIIALYEVYESPHYLFLITELATGGELMARADSRAKSAKKYYSEDTAKPFFRQLCKAVAFMHDNGIAHRDLKPENVLFSSKDNDAAIKVLDFGLAKKYDGNMMSTICGSYAYLPPEIILCDSGKMAQYDSSIDVWMLGLCLFIMVCGRNPFFDKAEGLTDKCKDKICKGNFALPSDIKLSNALKDLIKGCLTPDPKQRITVPDMLNHTWFGDEVGSKPKRKQSMASKAMQSIKGLI